MCLSKNKQTLVKTQSRTVNKLVAMEYELESEVVFLRASKAVLLSMNL